MKTNNSNKRNLSKKAKIGIVLGVPLFLFLSGVLLVTATNYSNLKLGYYLFSLAITDNTANDGADLEATVSPIATPGSNASADPVYPEFGDLFGTIKIDACKIEAPLINADTDEYLAKGVCHFTGSVYPGDGGNVVLFAKENTYLKGIGDVKKGDKVTLTTTFGNFSYTVSSTKIISAEDDSIIEPTDNDILTIYTSYPFNFIGDAPKRYVVLCTADGNAYN